jgi:hypothetical protein
VWCWGLVVVVVRVVVRRVDVMQPNNGGQMGSGGRRPGRHAARGRWPALQRGEFAVDCETLGLQAGGCICWRDGVGEGAREVQDVLVGTWERLRRVMEWPARATGRAARADGSSPPARLRYQQCICVPPCNHPAPPAQHEANHPSPDILVLPSTVTGPCAAPSRAHSRPLRALEHTALRSVHNLGQHTPWTTSPTDLPEEDASGKRCRIR